MVNSNVSQPNNGNEFRRLVRRVREFCSRDGRVSFAIIFGSYAKGEQRRQSDLDIAIYLNKPIEGVAVLFFLNALSEFIGKDANLVILNSASAFLRHQVMKYGIPVIIKDEVVYRQFREKTISDYDEYLFVSGMSIYG